MPDDSYEFLLAQKKQMIAKQATERERLLIYWLLRAYQSSHREGWEEGPSDAETMDGVLNVLANLGFDPNLSDAAKELLAEPPRYY